MFEYLKVSDELRHRSTTVKIIYIISIFFYCKGKGRIYRDYINSNEKMSCFVFILAKSFAPQESFSDISQGYRTFYYENFFYHFRIKLKK